MGKLNIFIVGVVCRVWAYIERIFRTENCLFSATKTSRFRGFLCVFFIFFRISTEQMLTFGRRCSEPSVAVASVVPFAIFISSLRCQKFQLQIHIYLNIQICICIHICIFLDEVNFKCYDIVANNNFS